MSGLILIVFAVSFLIRGLLRIWKPTWGSLYRIWTIKYESEPSQDYIKYIKSSGRPYIALGLILFVSGILIMIL
ncbi:hypothetical protein AMS62_07760 [Bacillus sp. FJAT-18019]|nr:hypothetical protein AMS62_07760 [Bacillus sp. FJAT-18019]